MARDFNGTSDLLALTTAVLTAEPITMACFFESDSITANQNLISLGNNGDEGFFRLAAMGGVASDPLRAQKQGDVPGAGSADTSSGYSADSLHHAAAVFTSDTDRAVFLDGGSKGTDATDVPDPTADFTSIGVLRRNADSQFFNGGISEVGLWNVALNDDEIASLAAGFSPLLVRPQNLVRYWPIIGRTSPEIDLMAGDNMTVTGTTVAAHPPIIYPTQPISGFAAAAEVGGVTIPIFDRYYRSMRAA